MNTIKSLVIVICGLALFLLPSAAFAQSISEISNLPETVNTAIGQSTEVVVNFKYTGGATKLSASVQGDVLPPGLSLSPVEYGASGATSVKYAGVPTRVGDYPLTLVITDSNGLSATKKFTVKVSDFTLTTTSLPTMVAGKKYSTPLKFTYAGAKVTPLLKITDITPDAYLNIAFMNLNAASDGSFLLTMSPIKVGKFSFKATVMIGNLPVATQVYTVNVVKTDAQARTTQTTTSTTKTATTTTKSGEETETVSEVVVPETNEDVSWFRKVLHFFRDLF